jgi:hypothetical protein
MTEVSAGRANKTVAVAGLVLALAILAGGVRQLSDASEVLVFDTAAKNIHDGIPVARTTLASLASKAFTLNAEGKLHGAALEDASIVAGAFALSPDVAPVVRPAMLVSAENVVRARLAEAPADSHAWIRLVVLRDARLGLDATALEALRMSRLTGRREFAVMWPSLRFRVAHWDALPVEERDAASDIVAGLWRRASRPDLIAYFTSLPPTMRGKLLASMTDPDARTALARLAAKP